MRLPNAEHAAVDIRKLRDYCLNPSSPRGRTKARVFASVLGLTQADAGMLRRRLLAAAVEQECRLGEQDEHGQRYTVDFQVDTDAGSGWVRSGWIVKTGERVPRLTTCYVLPRK